MNRADRRRAITGRDVPTQAEVQIDAQFRQMRDSRRQQLLQGVTTAAQHALNIVTQVPRDTAGYDALRNEATGLLREYLRWQTKVVAALPVDLENIDGIEEDLEPEPEPGPTQRLGKTD